MQFGDHYSAIVLSQLHSLSPSVAYYIILMQIHHLTLANKTRLDVLLVFAASHICYK